MRYNFEKAARIIEEIGSYEGEAMMWFRQVWEIAGKHGFDQCCTTPAHFLNTVGFIYGMCRVYNGFAARYFDYDESEVDMEYCCDIIMHDFVRSGEYAELPLDTDGMDEECVEQSVKAFIKYAICDYFAMAPVFKVLKSELGVSKTFASLYYCLNYEKYSLADWETDDFYYDSPDDEPNEDYEQRKFYASLGGFDELLDNIFNEVDIDKLSAVAWLVENM
ncbi:MAG: hypothetical protein K2O14_05150 [Oscillospiraceae bacterium]|nr:hypothetical protein [Oscillospiraceae bacterium]